jgi:hypothetical protein
MIEKIIIMTISQILPKFARHCSYVDYLSGPPSTAMGEYHPPSPPSIQMKGINDGEA